MPLLSGTAHAFPSANASGENYKHATPTVRYALTGNHPKGARPSLMAPVTSAQAVAPPPTALKIALERRKLSPDSPYHTSEWEQQLAASNLTG